MTATAIQSREQALAGALAFAMHVLFLALLVFSVTWQQKQIDTAVVVDLWRDLPPLVPPQAEAPPPPPAVKPEPPPPPAPKVAAKPPPAPAPKPDIALKEKLEQERRLKAQQAAEAKRIAAEKAREAELEKKKRAVAEALKQKQAAAAEAEAKAKRDADEQRKAREALAAQQAAAQARVVDEYKRRISDKIRRFIVLPPNVDANAQVEFEITVLPGGEVLGAKLKRAANSIPAYDAAVERAILRAQPLPLPPDPALMRQFRELNLVFRPKE